jgi:RHS repeat-associated protein
VGNTAFNYNAKGELIWQASGSSVSSTPTTCDYSVSNADKVSFFYNNIGMVTNVNYGDSSPDLVYAYDAGNRIQKLTAGSVVNEYAYNSLNLLTQETMSVDGRTFTLGYAYNANGDLLSTTYPSVGSPITVIYAPNALGQATRVGSYASNASYHPNGMPASHQYGNGFRHTSTQFNSGLPNAFYDNKGGTYALSHRFTYDANNNITFLDDRVDSAYDLRLTYDGLDRLDTITDSYLGSGSVDYDTMGNIKKYKLGSRTINYSYNSKKQLAYTSGSKVYDFSYDSKGNVIDNGARTFNYNTANQMVQSGGFYYTYDGNGKRVKEVGSKGTSYSFYGSNGKLMSRFEDGQTINYYYLNSKLVAQTKGNEVSYLHSDYLGSPAAVTKATGNSIERMHYQPFGESIGSPKDDVGYTGHKFDTDLGLNYMQARYYDPVIGRFYSNDPVGFRDLHSFNRYAYANNNPYKYIDPTGMCSTDRDGNAVSGICPAPGDSDADELINDRLSDSNSIASSVESALNESGLIVYVDTTVVASATESVVTAAPDSSQPPGDQSGEVLIGLTPGSVVGTSGDSSDVGLIEFTAVEAFEHEFSHVSDSINGISPIGSGVITVSGAPVDRIANGVNTGLDEARAVNKTNRFRTKSGMNKQRTQY